MATRLSLLAVCGFVAWCGMPDTAAADPVATSTSSTSSNGSSTGVGNAGSFGIGSGTSDSISTATATSNGFQGTDNSVESSTSITTLSTQDLSAFNTDNRITVTNGNGSPAPALQTGATTLSGSSFANYSGILNNGWNTAPAGIAQAATNVAINGNFGGQ